MENGKNFIKKGEIIFARDEAVNYLGIVLSGRVLIKNAWMRLEREQGAMLALNDWNRSAYRADYMALEDSAIFLLPVTGSETLHGIAANNDYRAIMAASQFKLVTELTRLRDDLHGRAERLFRFTGRTYRNYQALCLAMGVEPLLSDELNGLEACKAHAAVSGDKLGYYAEAAGIPLAAHKSYYSYSGEMVCYLVAEIAGVIDALAADCAALTGYLKRLLDLTALLPDRSLFDYACAQGQKMKEKGEVPGEMQAMLSNILDEALFQYQELDKQTDMHGWDENAMRARIRTIVSEESAPAPVSREEKAARAKREAASLKGTLEQVMKYACYDVPEKVSALRLWLDFLVRTPDRLSAEEDVKKAKRIITPLVFELYLATYRRARLGLTGMSKAAELFLNYGMLDERLLDEDQLLCLCAIEPEENEGPCSVFTMYEWLAEIEEGRRDPSKNEFDEDYLDSLRTMKKNGEINERQQKELAADTDRRVEYEVMNMLKSNMRVLYGQPSTYMPVLYKEAVCGYIDKLLMTKKKINESVQNLLKIDYSVFYREVLYSNEKLKLVHESCMKNVYPDIILLPICGVNASMWQETGGRNKATPGRFIFPILSNSSADDMMIKMFGRFRWELCRCMLGMQWNDIQVRSLTSEYMDYIQFYRKNRDLSDEARDKLKLQIQKGRGNSREIFLIDYEAWIKSESGGSMKLNRVAREILATYCPFDKALREKLSAQKPYEIAMARFVRNSLKKKQELELRIKAIQRETEQVPEEILSTYRFYAEM